MIKIKIDSRQVTPGDTFIAIIGDTFDGHDFIDQAISNGATKIIAQKGEYFIEYIIVSNTKEYLEEYLVTNYAHFFKDLKIIAITGTNGKTTTAYLAYQMLNELNISAAYIGTIGFYANKEFIQDLNNTTPNILETYELLLQCLELNCQVVIMEVSSHALVQNRIKGLKLDAAVFTNLTQEHLDYHQNIKDYLNAKLKIMDYLKQDGVMIVNSDDAYAKYFNYHNLITVGETGSNYKLEKYTVNNNLNTIYFNNLKVTTNLSAKFNVYNYLMALAAVNTIVSNIETIINISSKISAPKGRCEIIPVRGSIAVVDYAHTPDAVLKIITAFKSTKGKIITIIGCGGDRDRTKRPIMATIATTCSDHVVFTNDNPRTEDPKEIISDMIKDLENTNYEVIYDRSFAIKKGLELLKSNDVLLILGKGHEEYQIIGKDKKSFSDCKEVLKLLDL